MRYLYFGINTSQLFKITFELAEKNIVKHKYNAHKKCLEMTGFMKRNPTITLHRPEPTSMTRVIGLRRNEISRIYTNLAEVLAKEKTVANRIQNVDQTGMSTVHKEREKILSP